MPSRQPAAHNLLLHLLLMLMFQTQLAVFAQSA
jgi:hypothetical protein